MYLHNSGFYTRTRINFCVESIQVELYGCSKCKHDLKPPGARKVFCFCVGGHFFLNGCFVAGCADLVQLKKAAETLTGVASIFEDGTVDDDEVIRFVCLFSGR